jgi:mono/diheme cytochrome c family protein
VIALAFGVAYLVTRGDDGSSTAPGAGQGVGHAGETPPAKTQSSVAAGRTVFSENCSTCHGVTGHGGNGGPDLTAIPSARNRARVIRQVTNGGGGMPPFRGTLSQKQIDDVAAYVTKVVTKR